MVMATWLENLREMARFQGKNERQKPKRLARKGGALRWELVVILVTYAKSMTTNN